MRPVVIKRILPHLARKKDFVDMFLDEARIVAGIRHPNVVQVTELGHEAGEQFLAMEYLEGESTSGLMRRMQVRYKISFLFSSHDRSLIGAADDLITLKDGVIQSIRRKVIEVDDDATADTLPDET